MAAKYWCDYCKRIVPKHKQNVTSQVALLWIMILLGGLFTCGLMWLMWFFLPLIQIGAAMTPKCPICQANTRPATKAQIEAAR